MLKHLKNILDRISSAWKTALPIAKTIWKGYGYYIALACLITVFGITAYLYRNQNTESAVTVAHMEEPEYAAAISMLSATPEPVPAPTPYAPAFIKPVSGDITTEFSPDELIWNETLGQWLTHNGIDIAAGAGTVVTASESGVISAAYEDTMLGSTIEIAHSDGWITRYCSLETLNLIEVGQQVGKGEIISSVGSSALCESTAGAHLHFELLKDGKYVNPEFE